MAVHDRIMIGVDGGGTHTLAVAARADGTILGREKGAGINFYNIGMDKARENLASVIDRLCSRLSEPYDTMCVGISALDSAADSATTKAFAGDVFDPDRLDLQSDAYTALMGFSLGQPGMIIICGTGSMMLLTDAEGKQHVRGGWGHILGDPGASHTIALKGLRAAISDWEGIGEKTLLREAAEKCFSLSEPRELIERIYCRDYDPSYVAKFAREVLMLCEAGDAQAIKIVKGDMEYVAAQAAALLRESPEVKKVGLYGGVLTRNPKARGMLTEALLAKDSSLTVRQPEYPPELGAIIHCYVRYGMLNDDILNNLKTSYAALVASEKE